MKGNYKKLQLGATSYDSRGNDTSTNTLWLCRHPSDTLWFARIIRPDQRTVHFTVTRERHPNVRVPGAARWVWRDDDEAAWVMCDVGCCTTNSLMS